ncbi:alpha/beta fold hydrolase [Variovorax terrae]|uniref:Alpha/beta fold hydrolase n=1 Tax=Variovorax terrae TaxID=2923278 RepID=A0A9X1VUP6_9BURK|nr:alpha/beta fold hydrolase [Variovorax terrae]MCJ0763600.1 alpha/beta fold hydrolase [Variovorax terrae]
MSTAIHDFRHTGQPPAIAFDVAGEGEPILFLHGIGGNRQNWAGQLAHFGARFRAISLDFRGYGDSAAIEEPFEFADFVEDALRVLDALEIGRAHVVGLSMGGLVAQALYARAPQRVASLCLTACRSGAEPVLQGARREGFISARLGPLNSGGPQALAQSLAPTLIGRQATAEAREQVMASLGKLRPDSYLKIMEARMRIAPFLDPATVAVPVLVIGSDEDTVAPLAQMRDLAASIPQAQLAVIGGAGHLVNIEKPQEFNHALLAFLGGAAAEARPRTGVEARIA